jgi:hypothetical protein
MSMRRYIALGVISLAIFAGFAGARLKIHTQDNHFVYLADAFLRGQVELTRTPHHGNDWANYERLHLKGESAKTHGQEVKGFFTRRKGKPNEFRTLKGANLTIPKKDRGHSQKHHFVSFPPGPAVLMVPFVAAVGYGTNDVLFTILFASLNAVLFFMLLLRFREAGYTDRDDKQLLWFTALFIFGSAHFWCAVMGRVWFTALIVGVTFHLLYLYFALDTRRPFLAGVCLAVAFSSRASLVFGAVFFYWQLISPRDPELDAKARWTKALVFSAPCLVIGLILLYYNYVRFENPLEFGHTYLAGGTLARIRDYGLFHPDFLNRNLTAAFTLTPRLTDAAPFFQLSKHGMSIFLTTPALIWLFWPRRTDAALRPMWIATACIGVPLLFYQNTGWEQFSYRFVLDVLPYLILLLIAGARPLTRSFKTLIIIGVLINALGAATFQRAGMGGLYGHHMSEEPRR